MKKNTARPYVCRPVTKTVLAKKAQTRQDEQAGLLRQILAELRRLNANLERKSAVPAPQGTGDGDSDEDSEELEYFE